VRELQEESPRVLSDKTFAMSKTEYKDKDQKRQLSLSNDKAKGK